MKKILKLLFIFIYITALTQISSAYAADFPIYEPGNCKNNNVIIPYVQLEISAPSSSGNVTATIHWENLSDEEYDLINSSFQLIGVDEPGGTPLNMNRTKPANKQSQNIEISNPTLNENLILDILASNDGGQCSYTNTVRIVFNKPSPEEGPRRGEACDINKQNLDGYKCSEGTCVSDVTNFGICTVEVTEGETCNPSQGKNCKPGSSCYDSEKRRCDFQTQSCSGTCVKTCNSDADCTEGKNKFCVPDSKGVRVCTDNERGYAALACSRDSAGTLDFECKTAIGTITASPEAFVKTALAFFLGIAGGILLILLIFNGYKLMVSQGDPEKIKDAREGIIAAISGLFLIIFSLSILALITSTILNIPGF